MFCCINIFFLFHPISFRVLSFLSAPDAASCLLVLAHSSNFVVAIANLLFVGLWGRWEWQYRLSSYMYLYLEMLQSRVK